MTAFEELVRALETERAVPRPPRYRNPRRDYLAEIEELRAAFRQLDDAEAV